MFKKVKFYQSQKAQDKYQIPKDLRKLVNIDDDEVLKEIINARISVEIDKEIKKMENKL